MEPFVKHHIEGNCGIIEFGNLSGNSLTSNMLNGLCQNLTSLDSKKQVKVILLKSAGLKAFSGGASFTELKTLKSFSEASRALGKSYRKTGANTDSRRSWKSKGTTIIPVRSWTHKRSPK